MMKRLEKSPNRLGSDMKDEIRRFSMADKEQTEKKQSHGTLYDATRMVLMAAVGAASLAQEEMSTFVDRLVERGEMAESDARKLVREMMDRREKMERERKAQDKKASGTASKSDVEALTARIAELTRQVEELKKAQEN
jgi:polyhydroxyalkanoate synthesis regulator phasin